MLILICVILITLAVLAASKKLDIELHYPMQHMVPAFSRNFVANVTSDKLTCFGNHDYIEPAYRQTLMCMLPLPTQLASKYFECDNVWGSRVVVVNVRGSVEFIKLSNLPEESPQGGQFQGTRWLELQSVSVHTEQREIKTIPAEPFYLCARSIDWAGNNSSFQIDFRPAYQRSSDRFLCSRKIILHVILVLAVSSMWLLPYIASFVTCTAVFILGIDRFFAALVFSALIVCLAPLMLTKKNRRLARLFWIYFFGRRQPDREEIIRKKELPLFQAAFFSCALMCTGSAASYIIYSYFGVDREARNHLISLTMGMSAGWFVFVLCRSFEVFFSKWSWVMLTLFLAQFMDPHINPSSQEEAAVAVLVITLACNKLLVPSLNLHENLCRWGIGIQDENNENPMTSFQDETSNKEQSSNTLHNEGESECEKVNSGHSKSLEEEENEKIIVTVTVTLNRAQKNVKDGVFVKNVEAAVHEAVKATLEEGKKNKKNKKTK